MRTTRDVKCLTCKLVEERLLRHDADGEPPTKATCRKCGGTARVLPVMKLNVVGTTWSKEEDRARQVYGEAGLREGKRITGGDQYERALEEKGLAPANARETRRMFEQGADYKADADRRRGDPVALKELTQQRIIERNNISADSAASAKATAAMMGGAAGFTPPPEVAKELAGTSPGLPQNYDAGARWRGVFHDVGEKGTEVY